MTRDGYNFAYLYTALVRHFAKGTYDYFKYNGKINFTPENYQARNDLYSFEKAARVVPQVDWQDYIVANLVHDGKAWIRYMKTERMGQWRQHLSTMPTKFRQDCELLSTHDLSELITGPGIPPIGTLAMRDAISIETLIIIDYFIEFMDDPSLKEAMAWPAFKLKVKKYRPFLLQKLGDMTYYSDIMREIFIERNSSLN